MLGIFFDRNVFELKAKLMVIRSAAALPEQNQNRILNIYVSEIDF